MVVLRRVLGSGNSVYKGQESRGSIGTEGHPLGRGVSRDEDEKPVEGRPQRTL